MRQGDANGSRPDRQGPSLPSEITVPDVLRNRAALAGMPEWVDGLPDLIAYVAEAWSIMPSRSMDGGTESLVLEVESADGEQAILKLLLPHDPEAARNEITVLRLAGARAARACTDTTGREEPS